MKLLGLYNSKLQAFHYEELLQLYKQAITKGDFAGSRAFDETTISGLIQQSQDFASLPLAAAGQRVTDDSLNNPLNLLITRFNSIVSEANDFDVRAAELISVLEKDTILLDQLLAGANLQAWVAKQPQLRPSQQFDWNYGMGHGVSSSQVTQKDPLNDVIYTPKCPINTYLDVVDGTKYTGLVAPDIRRTVSAKNLQWKWSKMTSGEQSEDLYGTDWTELNLLEDKPLINFLPNPAVQVVLPTSGSVNGVFSIAGSVLGGSLPIYIRTLFVPRRNEVAIMPQNALLSGTFEAGLTGWGTGDGWSLTTGADAHMGIKYEAKGSFALWSIGATYSAGNDVRYLGKEYRSLSNGNTGNYPNAVNSTWWTATGVLASAPFPLSPRSKIYMETWVKNISANGILNIALSCRDLNDVEVGPQVAVPGITSADEYVLISEILEAIDSPAVTSGRLLFSVHGQTTGTWAVDDVRVHLPQNLSAYVVNQDDVAVYTQKTNTDQPLVMYFENEEFVVDDISNVTFMNLVDGVPYTVRFTENYPAYQCSVNEKVWSPITMLDPDRPYPDTEKNFDPIQILNDTLGARTLFPITDEIGVPTGLTLQMISRPAYEYYLGVTTPATPQYGATAVLEIDLSQLSYLNGLVLTPFSTYPIRLVKVEAESFTVDTRHTIGAPNALLDRPMVLTFPTTLLRKIYLTCYQENYNLSEHQVEPPDALRRDTLFALQTVLPFNVRRPSRAVPVYYRGAQYVFGLEGIAGISTTPELPGVFVAGSHHFIGCPDVFRFDVDYVDVVSSLPNLDVYLCWKAYNKSGVLVNSELDGVYITPGSCSVFPFPVSSLLDRSTVDHVDIFLKFVIRSEEVVVQRYLLQVSRA